MQVIFEPINMKFRNNLVSKLSRLLSRFQLGMVPIFTKVFKPWMDKQGSGWQFSITASCSCSITIETNSLSLA